MGLKKRLMRFAQKAKNPPKTKHIHILGFLLALLCIGLVLAVLLTLLVPAIVRSARSLYAQFQGSIPGWISWLDGKGNGTTGIENILTNLDLDRMLESISNGLDAVLIHVADALSSTVGLTLIAAMVGGKLFGIPGILFFIPLAAVGIELVREDAAARLARRNIRMEQAPTPETRCT